MTTRREASARGHETLVELAFASPAWIVDTANRLFLTYLVDAGVIAGHAEANEIGASCLELVRRLRIGEELAGHADQIGLARSQHILGALRRGDATECDDGKPCCRASAPH